MSSAMIIDKDPLISSLVEFLINYSGLSDVVSFTDSEEAVLCAVRCPDIACVVCNWDSIGNEVVEVVGAIRKKHPNVRVLLLSEKKEAIKELPFKHSTVVLGDRFFTLTLKRCVREALEIGPEK